MVGAQAGSVGRRNATAFLLRRCFGRMAATAKKARRSLADVSQRIIWIDCEMTGLDADTDHLVEIACIVTEGDLSVVDEGPNIVIKQPESVLATMSDWCREHFAQNGLTEAIRASRVDLAAAEDAVLRFVAAHTTAGACPLAGNSVSADRAFLKRHMPILAAHLHHRTVDVSTIKELCSRWYPSAKSGKPSKASNHRALDDIRESIIELQYYRKAIFIHK